jgi:predicted GNAT family acetyltransferase
VIVKRLNKRRRRGAGRDHPHVRFIPTRDLGEFAAHVEGFLAARLDRHVLATVLWHARRGRFDEHPPLCAYGLDAGGRVCAAALRTPPAPLLASELDGAGAAALIERWLPEDPDLPGVVALSSTARMIAGAWERATGGRSRCRMREAMYELSAVTDPPLPASGRLRPATAADRELLIRWERAFAAEAGVVMVGGAEQMVERRLRNSSQFLWDADGPVSTLALSPMIAGTVRIGPVYTPPAHRRRGYAGSAVAAACRLALARGAERCALFADLENPTSNGVYLSVGFTAIADWEEHEFGLPPDPLESGQPLVGGPH